MDKAEKNWGGWGYGGSPWTPIGGGTFGGGSDIYNSQPSPGPWGLLKATEDTVFSCVTLIAHNMATVELKLCVATGEGEERPRARTKRLSRLNKRLIEAQYHRHTRKAAEVDEVVEHRLLDLLDHPNPTCSGSKLIGDTSYYLDTVGSAFWHKTRNDRGEVVELWLLPSQSIVIDSDDSGNILYYRYNGPDGERLYKPQDIIHFRHFNGVDPYLGFGISPLRAIWQKITLGRQELTSWQSILTNMAWPSLAISPAEGEVMTEDQGTRLARQFAERFRFGGEGGVYVNSQRLQIDPLNAPPKDMTALTSLSDNIKNVVCNAYFVPRALLDMQESNYASATTAKRFFQEHCLAPRVHLIIETLNHHLANGRFFFATTDDVVQPDRTFELQETTSLVTANVLTINEARERQGLEPVVGHDKFVYELTGFGMAPATAPHEDHHDDQQPVEQQPQGQQPVEQEGGSNELRGTVGGLQAIQSMQIAYTAGEIARPACVAAMQLLFGFSTAEAESLFPEKPPVDRTDDKPQQPQQPVEDKAAEVEVDTKAVEPEQHPAADLVEVLQGLFRKQREQALAKFKAVGELTTKAFVATEDWTADMARALNPVLRIYYDQGSASLAGQIGGGPELARQAVPALDEAVRNAALVFADSTTRTTTMAIDRAVEEVREAIKNGLAQGEANNQLAERIGGIFADLETRRVYLIAETESSRARHQGELVTAQESGLDVKKRWLQDSLSCPLCHALDGQVRGLDEPFVILGPGPYGTIQHPPYHPSCRCTLTYEVE